MKFKFCFSFSESFDDALQYKNGRRNNVGPKSYNFDRVLEQPIPIVNLVGVNNDAHDNENPVDNNDIDQTPEQLIRILNPVDITNAAQVSDPLGDVKQNLPVVNLDENDALAFQNMFVEPQNEIFEDRHENYDNNNMENNGSGSNLVIGDVTNTFGSTSIAIAFNQVDGQVANESGDGGIISNSNISKEKNDATPNTLTVADRINANAIQQNDGAIASTSNGIANVSANGSGNENIISKDGATSSTLPVADRNTTNILHKNDGATPSTSKVKLVTEIYDDDVSYSFDPNDVFAPVQLPFQYEVKLEDVLSNNMPFKENVSKLKKKNYTRSISVSFEFILSYTDRILLYITGK